MAMGPKRANFLLKFLIVTEYEGHVFRVATYLAHYWTLDNHVTQL